MDNDTVKIKFKGKTFPVRPVTPEQVAVLSSLRGGGSGASVIRALTRILAKSVGEEKWEEISDGLVEGTVKLTDLNRLFETIIKVTSTEEDREEG